MSMSNFYKSKLAFREYQPWISSHPDTMPCQFNLSLLGLWFHLKRQFRPKKAHIILLEKVGLSQNKRKVIAFCPSEDQLASIEIPDLTAYYYAEGLHFGKVARKKYFGFLLFPLKVQFYAQ